MRLPRTRPGLPALLVWLGALYGHVASAADDAAATPLPDGLYAEIATPRGELLVGLFFDEVPLTVANFVGLAEGTIPFHGRPEGSPFFDGLTFHRVVPGFVIQGGDPRGTGEGDPGYKLQDEFSPKLKHDTAGTLAMANAGPNDNGCQFYLTLDRVNRLDYKHTVFGRVVRGIDVLPRIRQGDAITRVTIVRAGEKAAAFRPDEESFARLRDLTPVIAPRDPTLPPLFADESGLDLPSWFVDWTNQKLHHYAIVSGITIRVRVVAQLAASPDDDDTAATTPTPLRQRHASLAGDEARAATLVFARDSGRWHLRLGDDLLPRFGLPVRNEADSNALHAFKRRLLAPAEVLWTPQEPPRRTIDVAITNLITALDRPESARED